MTRTIISLDSEEKSWLDRKAEETGLSMAEIVRQAIRSLREREQESFDEVLKQTRGLWRRGDGLAYQRRIRKQW